MAGRNNPALMSRSNLLNSCSVRGELKPVIVVDKQITVMIAMCHVMLAVPVVLGCHFMLATTKQMKEAMHQTVLVNALDKRGYVITYSIPLLH